MTSSGIVGNQICDYNVISAISAGTFSTCYTVKHKKCGKIFVWKAVDYGSMTDNQKKMLISEINFVVTIKHPHIARFYTMINHVATTTLFIVMEWCQRGDLESLIRNCQRYGISLNEGFVWKTLYQTLKALQEFHLRLYNINGFCINVQTRDIYLDENFNVKLNQFSLQRLFKNEENSRINNAKAFQIRSLGYLIYEMCTYSQLFHDNGIQFCPKPVKIKRFPKIPIFYSEPLKQMIEFILSINCESPISVETILYHPYVVENYSIKALPINNPEILKNPSNYPGKEMTDNYRNNNFENGAKKSLIYDKLPIEIDSNKENRSSSKFHSIKNIKSIGNENSKFQCGMESENLDSKLMNFTESNNKDNLNSKLHSKIKQLRRKEASLQAKEFVIKQKEELIEKREQRLLELEKCVVEPRTTNYRDRSIKEVNGRLMAKNPKFQIKNINLANDLDSTTCSADPGDSSLIATTAKLNPRVIMKPTYFSIDTNTTSASTIEKKSKRISFAPFIQVDGSSSLTTTSWSVYRRNYKFDTAETISKEVKYTKL